MTEISPDLLWWITVIELPLVAAIFTFIWRIRAENARSITQLQCNLDHRSDQMREALMAFKLEVAKTYASQRSMRELELRLVDHLLRIEAKLDKTALKAEGLQNRYEGDPT